MPDIDSAKPDKKEVTATKSFVSPEMKGLEEVLTRINFALGSASLYPAGHPIIDESIQKMYEILNPLLKKYSLIPIQFIDDEVLFKEEIIMENRVTAKQLSDFFRDKGIGFLIISEGLMMEELRSLVYSFRVKITDNKLPFESLNQLLWDKNVTHIKLEKLIKKTSLEEGTRIEKAKQIYARGVELFESVAIGAVSQRVVDINSVRPLVEDLIENLSDDSSALLAVTSLKSYDNYIFTHSMNVCILSLALAIYIKTDPRQWMDLGVGALLHDIGKLAIPLEILHKPGKLSDSEWELIRRHPIEGMKMLLNSKYASEMPTLIVYCHHWRYIMDGGYPTTKRKYHYNLYSRLVSICDTYDAMTTNRPYNKMHLPTDAVTVIRQFSGTYYDPQLVTFFTRMIGPYSIGMLVQLNTGEIGIVIRVNPEEQDRPYIKIAKDANGNLVKDIQLVDLSEKDYQTNEYPRIIVKAIDSSTVDFNIWEYL